MSPENFGAAAVLLHEAKHAAADSLLFNSAGFFWDNKRRVYVVSVRGYVVAEPKTLRDVSAFCDMHNGRMAEAMS